MKLAKKISARITFCTILSIFTCIIWGGVTSCSNGSDDPERIPNSDVPQGWTEIIVGDIEKYNGQDGTTAYTVQKNKNGSITISHDTVMAKYASCSFKPNFGENNTIYMKITNNSDVEATIQVQVNKAGTKDNDYEPMPTVTAVYVDKEKRSDASEYSVKLKIDANKSVVIANMFDTAKSPDTVAISLNSQESVAGEMSKGNITVSGVSMKKITDESELGTLTGGDPESEDPGKDEGGETTPPATDDETNEESKGIVFDFTKAVTDGDVKIDNVTYCSADASKFSSENGLVLEVNNSWDGAFKIATNALDLSNKNCVVEYKIDKNWKYTSSDGKKCLIQLISKEQDSDEYKPIELSQGEFAKESTTTGSWKTETIDNIYKNYWDVANDNVDYSGADLTKIIAIKINTTDGVGTIHIKSLKFVDKE